MQRVNLYQQQFRPKRDVTDAFHLALGLGVVVLVLAAISGFQVWGLQQAQQRLTAAQAERAAARERLTGLREKLQAMQKGDDGTAERIARLRKEYEAKRRLLKYLESGPLAQDAGFARYLEGLAARIVDGVWLERVRLANGGSQIRIDGHATEAGHVPRFMSALGKAPAYGGRTFRTLDLQRAEDDTDRIDFVLASKRVQPGKEQQGQGDGS